MMQWESPVEENELVSIYHHTDVEKDLTMEEKERKKKACFDFFSFWFWKKSYLKLN